MYVQRQIIVEFVREAGMRYWPNGPYPADALLKSECDISKLGQNWVKVRLPGELESYGIDGCLLVDAATIAPGVGSWFARCDWYLAAFAYLSGIAEQRYEQKHGPVHSYACRLRSFPAECFDYAWANRILLLMRAMEAHRRNRNTTDLFGPLPEPRILLTHDIDAIDKTLPIRLKQTMFELFNTIWSCLHGHWTGARRALQRASCMALTTPSYLHLDKAADAAARHGILPMYFIYARHATVRFPLNRWLFDPGYRHDDQRLLSFVQKRYAQGCKFGIHPGFDSWADSKKIAEARNLLEAALQVPIIHVRQHWLRFSWALTWKAQSEAGLSVDDSLGFNDRAGFRTGAALHYRPWHLGDNEVLPLRIRPMILMDSHLYSYPNLSDEARKRTIESVVNEVRSIHGEATVLWHPHTLAGDYGWKLGFEELLSCLTHKRACRAS